jgi:hypothetical protein
MAELFSIVTSGIAAAQVDGKASGIVLKLKQL